MMRRRIVFSGLFTLLLGLVAGEVVLRIQGTFLTYPERNYGVYTPYYKGVKQGWLHTWPPGETREFVTREFTIEIAANREGVRDIEHDYDNPEQNHRIVILGDSFVEGIGVPFEQAWPQQLQRSLKAKGHAVEIIIGAMSGSDPCFSYKLLRQRLLAYRPQLVILAINSSDTEDLMAWGGMERFHPDGTTHSRSGPAFEPLYRRSQLVRFVVHRVLGYDFRFLRGWGRPQKLAWEAQLTILEVIDQFRALGSEHGFAFRVLVHPTTRDVATGSHPFFKRFLALLQDRGIDHWDLTPALGHALAGLEYDQYAWPIDKHFNAFGYSVFAAETEKALLDSGLLPPASSPR